MLFDANSGAGPAILTASLTVKSVTTTGCAFTPTIQNASVGAVPVTLTLNQANTVGDLKLATDAGTATGAVTRLLLSGGNQTITGTLSLSGNSATKRLHVCGSDMIPNGAVAAAAVTLSAGTIGTLSNVNFMDIAGAGAAAPFTGTLLGDGGGNSGITFTSPLTLYWFKDSGSWSDATKWFLATNGGGGAGRVPLPQDTARFDANSFTLTGRTITWDMSWLCAGLDASGNTTSGSSFQATTHDAVVFGSIALVGIGAQGTVWVCARSSVTFSSGGAAFSSGGILIYSPGGTVTQQDALSNGGSFSLGAGSWATANFSLTTVSFNSSNTNTRTLTLGSSVVTCTATSGTPWDTTTVTNLTITANTATVTFSGTGAGTKTLAFGSKNYNGATVRITGSGTGAWTISGSNTFAGLQVDGPAKTVNFTAGTTQTVTTLSINGSVGNLITLRSTSSPTKWTISVSGSSSCSYCDIKDSTGTGAVAPLLLDNTGANSTNSGNVTGWFYYPITAAAGSYAVTGAAASLRQGHVLSAAAGGYSVTGAAATIRADRMLPLGVGSYAVTGAAATVRAARLLSVGAGSFAVTGAAATVRAARRMDVVAGAYAVTGQAATIRAARRLDALAGAYSLAGSAATMRLLRETPGRVFDAPDDHREFTARGRRGEI